MNEFNNISPLISVITVVYNGEKYLNSAIKSIREQTYENIEYIIVDGGSRDGTLNIINDNQDMVNAWVSEKDSGIYDAMNKGIKLANGEYIGFLNADDWYEKTALESIFLSNSFQNNIDCFYANFHICDEDTNQIYTYQSSLNKINSKMTIGHPAMFVKSKWLKETFFDENFPIAADYDLVLTLLDKKLKFKHISEAIVNFRLAGVSTTTNVGLEVFKVHMKHFNFFHAFFRLLIYELSYIRTKVAMALFGESNFNNFKRFFSNS